VDELKKRLNDSRYDNMTVLGLAMDVGFNSKSSFNAAFKKLTGQSPSEYKKSQNRPE
jgi:AraC-like DNA-binding protein